MQTVRSNNLLSALDLSGGVVSLIGAGGKKNDHVRVGVIV